MSRQLHDLPAWRAYLLGAGTWLLNLWRRPKTDRWFDRKAYRRIKPVSQKWITDHQSEVQR